ncbi:MAG: PKD domain-containing protein [archaeon]|nr:PKD domain-containing protein [archaeon]MDA1168336.1 PKD domain-containing protein [archaeon]
MQRAIGRMKSSSLLFTLLLLCQVTAGCTGILDTTVNPRAELVAYPQLIQVGEMVTLDARESSAVEGVLVSYEWDFGDGQTAETVSAFTSHSYLQFGQYTVTVKVTNDQGGTDESTQVITVNGAPMLNLTFPEQVRAGDSILFDASATYDPEGAQLMFAWDLDWTQDTNGDTDPRNDVDAAEATVIVPTTSSGVLKGSVVVSDGQGASSYGTFEISIVQRLYEVVWIYETIEYSWDEYLEQGESWEVNMTPSEVGRIMEIRALLELDQDIAPPYDNFSLVLRIMDDGLRTSKQTEEGNYSNQESAKAEIEILEFNIQPENALYSSDSKEQLLFELLRGNATLNGLGEWIWIVSADQSDPDSFVPGMPDPDPGNDWELTIQILIGRPSLTEVVTNESSM